MPEWLKGTDCKSVIFGLRWFESIPAHHYGGVAQLARACGSYPQCPEFKSLRRHQLINEPLTGFLFMSAIRRFAATGDCISGAEIITITSQGIVDTRF